MKCKKWILAKAFSGVPSEENLKLLEFDLKDDLHTGEVLCQAVYLSVDPYMRFCSSRKGEVMEGEQLCEVIKTKNGKYPLGSMYLCKAGWQSHFISNGDNLQPIRLDIGSTPKSYALGAVGMPGATAYLAFQKCNPKSGETILISSAAGAVGHIVGQLAKLKGLNVIGIVGSDEKLKWCKNDLHYDHVINYKKSNYSTTLNRIASDGVDIFFDNVGGDFYSTIVNKHMKTGGRVLVCGSIQTYNDKTTMKTEETSSAILTNELSVFGFVSANHYDQWPNAFVEINKLIQEDKIKVREQVYIGIESMRDAFYGLFKGENIGKSIIKAVN